MNRFGLSLRSAAVIALMAALVLPEIVRLRDRPPVVPRVPAKKVVSQQDDCTAERALPTSGSTTRYFVDITDDVGIDFEHVVGPLGTYFFPEVNGTGAGFFDYDGDGDLDLLMVNAGRSPGASGDFPPGTRVESRLYRRDADGRFHDVTAESGLVDRGIGILCALGDVDNDGDVDVYMAKYASDRLFENDGRGRFADISQAAGIDNPEYTTGAAFFDYDRDGWLDLVVVNYTSDRIYGHTIACGYPDGRVSYCGPLKFSPTVDRLYHNEGIATGDDGQPHVRFRDVTEESGLSKMTTNGFGVVCADFDRDGWPDIFIANDMLPNRLWINGRDGTFREEAGLRGAAVSGQGVPQAGMGATTADLDGDGHLDLVVTHLTGEYAAFYKNDGSGIFSDVSRQSRVAGPTSSHTGWGVAAVDFDHDGHLDLAVANGLVVACHLHFPPHGEEAFQPRHDTIVDTAAYWRPYADQNVLLISEGNGLFSDVSQAAGDFVSTFGSARALACTDIDDDGDLDLLVTYCGQRARLYRNDVPKRGHWLLVRARDPQLRRDAYGAEVIVFAGGRRFRQLAQPSSGYLASHDPRVHFGLGDAERFEKLIVLWPDGSAEEFAGDQADRSIVVDRGTGKIVERSGL